MWINFLIGFCLSLSALQAEETQTNFPVVSNPQINMKSWVKVPLSVDSGAAKDTIELSFPTEPKLITEKDSAPYFTITDSEGMTFKVSALEASKEADVADGMAFLIKALQSMPQIKILYTELPPNKEMASIAWVSTIGQLIRLTAIKRKDHVYFLETSVNNPAFFSIETIPLNSFAYGRLKNDSIKNQAFVLSLSDPKETTNQQN